MVVSDACERGAALVASLPPEVRAELQAADVSDRTALDTLLRRRGVLKLGQRLSIMAALEVPSWTGTVRSTLSSVSSAAAAATTDAADEDMGITLEDNYSDDGGMVTLEDNADEARVCAQPQQQAAPPPTAAAMSDEAEQPIGADGQGCSVGPPPTFQHFRVVHKPYVYIREARDTQSHRLGYKWSGETVRCSGEVGGWLKLADEDGWMLRDGRHVGLGELLVPAHGPEFRAAAVSMAGAMTTLSSGDALSEQERLTRELIERVFPKHTPNPAALLRRDPDSLAASAAKGLQKTIDAYDHVGLPRALRERPAVAPADGGVRQPPADASPFAGAAHDDGGQGGGGGGGGGSTPPPLVAVDEVAASDMATERFEAEYVAANRPVIIRGALAEWPPLRRWTEADLRERCGARRVTVRVAPQRGEHGAMFGDVQRMQSYRTAEVTLSELLDDLARPLPTYYGARMHLGASLPELAADATAAGVGPAPFAACFGEPQATNPTIYLGAGRQATPMHFDPAENLLCVVEGGKDLTLFHPADTENVYPVGERNTKVIYSHVDFVSEGLDRSTFPKLAHAVPHVARVRRGDLLYLPCGWWHAVRGTEGRNLSVNFWYGLGARKRERDLGGPDLEERGKALDAVLKAFAAAPGAGGADGGLQGLR